MSLSAVCFLFLLKFWLVHWIVCVLCDWFTGLSVSFVIGSLDYLCPLWLVHWIFCPLWLVHWIVCVLCDWFTGLSECALCDWPEWLLWCWFYDNQLKTTPNYRLPQKTKSNVSFLCLIYSLRRWWTKNHLQNPWWERIDLLIIFILDQLILIFPLTIPF